MMPIDEAKITEYALGILDEAEFKAVQKAINDSKILQDQLDEVNHVLHQVALAEEKMLPGQDLKNSVLDAINEQPEYIGFIARFSAMFDLDRAAARQYLAKIQNLSDSAWQTTPFPGVMIMKFPGGPSVESATCGIVQVKSGVLFPAHQHQGDEQILVLQGFAKDDQSRELNVGDRLNFNAGSKHSFRILSEENFVFAVVLNKKNKWLLGKTLLDLLRVKKS